MCPLISNSLAFVFFCMRLLLVYFCFGLRLSIEHLLSSRQCPKSLFPVFLAPFSFSHQSNCSHSWVLKYHTCFDSLVHKQITLMSKILNLATHAWWPAHVDEVLVPLRSSPNSALGRGGSALSSRHRCGCSSPKLTPSGKHHDVLLSFSSSPVFPSSPHLKTF